MSAFLLSALFISKLPLAATVQLHDRMDMADTIARVNHGVAVCWGLVLVVLISVIAYTATTYQSMHVLELGALFLFGLGGLWVSWAIRPSTWPNASDRANWPHA